MRNIENVGRNSLHPRSHFLSRSSVILRCSSTASRNSVASSLSNLRCNTLRISAAGLPIAHTMKIRPNRFSYSRFPSPSAAVTLSFPAETSLCSCADHVAARPSAASVRSPIRGWLANASIQFETSRPRHTSSEAAISDSSLFSGRRAANTRAHAPDPQQGRISDDASFGESLFHRTSTSFIAYNNPLTNSLPSPETPPPDSPPPPSGTPPSIEYHQWAGSRWLPSFSP